MNDDLFERDLAATLRDIAGDEAPASLRYRLRAVTDAPAPRRRPWLAPLLQFSGVAIVAVVAAALGWVFLQPAFVGTNPTPTPRVSPGAPTPSATPGPSSSPSPSPSATPSPSPTPMPSASLAPVPSGWSALAWSDPVVPFPQGTDTMIQDVLPWGGGFVGVGSISSRFQCEEAAFLSSSDGVHWSVTDTFSSGDQLIAAMCPSFVVPLSDGLLAIGQRRLWSSSDGQHWTEVQSSTWPALWTSDLVELQAAAGGPAGVVAIGTDPGSGDAIVVHSTDGQVWQRVELPAQERPFVRDVVSYPGGFVIGGRDGKPDGGASPMHPATVPGVGRPAAWTSSDGISWTAASVEGSEVQGGLLDQLFVGANGLFAIGTDASVDYYENAPVAGWASTDGVDWQAVGVLGQDLPPMSLLASDGARIVGLGLRPMGTDREPTAWVSEDGRAWSALAVSGLAPDVGYLVLGEPRSDNPPDTALWVVPDGLVALGAGSTDPQLPQGQPLRLGVVSGP